MMARDWEQVTGHTAPGPSRERPPRTRRLLRRGPRIQPGRTPAPPAAAPAPAAQADPAAARTLGEWHDMTPGEQAATWAVLRAWVTWLYDRYELSVEDRLPRCWADPRGLVEQLSALRAWREEIYTSGQPSGQAARYWHAELRQVLHAAATQYALGCRTGHRGPATQAAATPALSNRWASADPMARIPAIDLTAGTARRAGRLAATAAIGAALDTGDAITLPGSRDTVLYQGTWWAPASAGWTHVPRPARPRPPAGSAPACPRGCQPPGRARRPALPPQTKPPQKETLTRGKPDHPRRARRPRRHDPRPRPRHPAQLPGVERLQRPGSAYRAHGGTDRRRRARRQRPRLARRRQRASRALRRPAPHR